MTRRIDREGARRAIAAFLDALGYESNREELAGTPDRVTDAFADELLRGEGVDLAALLASGSEPVKEGASGLVLVRGVRAVTVCPHHLLPGVGSATVAYLPGRRLVGLGALARLVDACGRRLTLQEHIGHDVVQALMEFAGARAAYCQLELLHTCFAARGEEQPEARLVTQARAGEFTEPRGFAELTLALNTPPGR